MTVTAIGLNHRTAPVEILEQVTFSADALPKVLAEVAGSDVISETVVLSTCNRTEFYLHAERFHDGFRDVRNALALLSGLAPESFDPYLYVHYHDDAARHLFEVAAGLDSVVLGEHEILGQVARAWEQARVEDTSGPLLNLLFQRAIESGKKVRTDTEIGRSTASLSHAAVSLLGERRPAQLRTQPDGSKPSVLLIGAGDLGSGVASALARKYDVELLITNRTPTRAEAVAANLGGRTVPLDALGQWLANVDIVVSATGSPEPILMVDDLRPATLARTSAPDAPLFVLDLALPHDVEIEAGNLPGVELVGLSALQDFANRGLEARRAQLGPAKAVVDAELERYELASSARQVAPLVGGLRAWAEAIRTGELDRYAPKLAGMNPADREAVEALSRSIVAKLLHQPTVALKDAAGTAQGDRLADAVRELFDQS